MDRSQFKLFMLLFLSHKLRKIVEFHFCTLQNGKKFKTIKKCGKNDDVLHIFIIFKLHNNILNFKS